jgi:hypothetical protein
MDAAMACEALAALWTESHHPHLTCHIKVVRWRIGVSRLKRSQA